MNNRVFASNLREIVYKNFKSVTDCARKAEIPRATIQSWLSGTEPTVSNFVKLARAVNMPLSELYYRLYLEKEIVDTTEKELGMSITQFVKEHDNPIDREYVDKLLKVLKGGAENDINFIKNAIDYVLKDLE